ncbi:hypothetical protein HXX76_009878 [Chlamydomonas incerta]|uniref:Uncharacterized protein n=1 Tax=Chlamydomonas incerta TaxID=51695 RepID=A0A835T1U2_CHLIN|nr:hypothetical protein HXX76_009878 [Chlamydomonas incerta]|eukprot:KAG2430905.1 hypothetical protein HXX76_009878 [Chlamydomonas incerta]
MRHRAGGGAKARHSLAGRMLQRTAPATSWLLRGLAGGGALLLRTAAPPSTGGTPAGAAQQRSLAVGTAMMSQQREGAAATGNRAGGGGWSAGSSSGGGGGEEEELVAAVLAADPNTTSPHEARAAMADLQEPLGASGSSRTAAAQGKATPAAGVGSGGAADLRDSPSLMAAAGASGEGRGGDDVVCGNSWDACSPAAADPATRVSPWDQ